MRTSSNVIGTALILVAISASLIWYAAIHEDRRGTLLVEFFGIGNSDAVFIETPGGRKILINGGPDSSVLRELGDVMPFYERSLDLVVATAQTPDLIGGLSSVLDRYSVSAVVRSAALSSAPQAESFVGAVSNAQQSGTRLLVAQRGTLIDMGSGTFIEFLFPDRDASSISPSDGCLFFKLQFEQTSFLFSCGPPSVEGYLATLDGERLRSDVLHATGKEPELFLGFVSPQFAVMPCGTGATSSAFEKLGIETLGTCGSDISFISDGRTVLRK